MPRSIDSKGLKFFHRLGGGKTVAVYLPEGFSPSHVHVQLTRRIEHADVKDGKLVSVFKQVAGRGGKRVSALDLRLETARALHGALGEAIKEADRRGAMRDILPGALSTLTGVLEAEPCRLTWWQRMHYRLLGW